MQIRLQKTDLKRLYDTRSTNLIRPTACPIFSCPLRRIVDITVLAQWLRTSFHTESPKPIFCGVGVDRDELTLWQLFEPSFNFRKIT